MLLFAIIVYVFLFFIIFFKANIYVREPSMNYLCKENTDSIKAVCAIIVMIHHISNELEYGFAFLPFQMAGYLMVALFFFYSGFGLCFSLLRDDKYINKFLYNRLNKLFVPFGIATLVYVCFYLFVVGEFNPIRLLSQFLFDEPVVKNSWFILVLIYLYFIFWLCFKIFGKRKLSWSIWIIVLLIWSFCVFVPYWAPTIVCFAIGFMIAYYKKVVDRLIKKYNVSISICSFAFVIALSIFKHKTGMLEDMFNMFSAIFFVLFVLSISTRIQIHNRILSFFSTISLEIYLYHGLVMLALNKIEFIYSRPIIYFLLTVIISIFTSWMMAKMKRVLCEFRFRKSKNCR